MFFMKRLIDFKEDIHKCSKCGLCQAECPIFKITGNDCSVSRGQFVMLQGIIRGDLKMSKTINRYLDLCLKCGACSKFCPAGIDVVDVIVSAKAEYFRISFFEKVKTFFQKFFIFGLLFNVFRILHLPTKSKSFDKKVVYFGGCGSKLKGDRSVVRVLNSIGIEVVNPNFQCCGIPYFSRGDLKEFSNSLKSYIEVLKKYSVDEVVTTCASCEKSLKDYIKWAGDDIALEDREFLKSIKVKNIYEYINEAQIELKLKKRTKMTYHKPCNIPNWEDISWLLKKTKNLEYMEMCDFDKCCGLNGLSKFKEYKILSKIFKSKRLNIKNTNTKYVTTSCLGCEIALKAYSFGQYKVQDLLDFIAERV